MSASIQAVLTGLGALVTIIAAVFAAVRWAVGKSARQARRVDTFLEDWYGEEERPGVPRRPGVMERLAANEAGQERIELALTAIKRELTTNGGSSLKDRVVSVDGRLAEVEKRVGTPVTVNVNPGAAQLSG